jgi:hypothetical protein
MATIHSATYSGLYRVTAYAVITSVTAGGTLEVKLSWTDSHQPQVGKVLMTFPYTTAGEFSRESKLIYATSGSNITHTTTLSGTATYNLYVDATAA